MLLSIWNFSHLPAMNELIIWMRKGYVYYNCVALKSLNVLVGTVMKLV